MTGVTSISTGLQHSLFLKAGGAVWAVGLNQNGELGDGTTTDRLTPVQVMTGITSQPASTTIDYGSTQTLSITAQGALSYQWYQGVSGITTSPISGAASFTYTTPALTSTTSYWVRFINVDGTVDSNTATAATAVVNLATVSPRPITIQLAVASA